MSKVVSCFWLQGTLAWALSTLRERLNSPRAKRSGSPCAEKSQSHRLWLRSTKRGDSALYPRDEIAIAFFLRADEIVALSSLSSRAREREAAAAVRVSTARWQATRGTRYGFKPRSALRPVHKPLHLSVESTLQPWILHLFYFTTITVLKKG